MRGVRRIRGEPIICVHSDLLAAAAVEPIIGDAEGHEVRFDEINFFERVLLITKAGSLL